MQPIYNDKGSPSMFEFQDSYAMDVPSTFMVQFMSYSNKLFLDIWVLKEKPWLQLHLLPGCPENSHRSPHSLLFSFCFSLFNEGSTSSLSITILNFFFVLILLHFWFLSITWGMILDYWTFFTSLFLLARNAGSPSHWVETATLQVISVLCFH